MSKSAAAIVSRVGRASSAGKKKGRNGNVESRLRCWRVSGEQYAEVGFGEWYSYIAHARMCMRGHYSYVLSRGGLFPFPGFNKDVAHRVSHHVRTHLSCLHLWHHFALWHLISVSAPGSCGKGDSPSLVYGPVSRHLSLYGCGRLHRAGAKMLRDCS